MRITPRCCWGGVGPMPVQGPRVSLLQVVTGNPPKAELFWHPPRPRQRSLNNDDTLRMTSEVQSTRSSAVVLHRGGGAP